MNRIKPLREERGMTQAELGKLLSVKDAAISKYESEKVPLTAETILKLANIFSVSTDYLLCYSDSKDETVIPLHEKYSSFGVCLKNSEYSYDELAVRLGISSKDFSDILCGKTMPSLEILLKLSELCCISTDYLIGISGKNRDKDLNGVIPFKYNLKISDRINELLLKSGYEVSEGYSMLGSILSLSNNEVYNMVTYGFIPHMDTVIKLANFLDVSIDYLFCISKDIDEKLLSEFRRLNDDNQDIIIGKLKELSKEQRYEESVAADTKKAVGK
ncbi:MAG: helix-turn-helix domain-containing protein [Velocimicrobium sp.]